jgi:glyoxylase-like metal-dependent hydrolase (beta-lactamase superfamily II)
MVHGSVKVGDVEVLAICDVLADFPMTLAETFPDVPEDEWPRFRERYPDAFTDATTWLVHDHCYLLRPPGRTILVDTGIGPLGPGVSGVHRSQGLPAALEDVGVKPEDVDTVVFTHLHFDHVGWNTPQDPTRPFFEKATHLVHRADWDVFSELDDPLNRAAFERNIRPLEPAGVLELIDGPLELLPGISVVPAPGHTLGHVVVSVNSGDDQVLISGDLVNHPAQLAEPAWREIGDMDVAAAADSRRRIFGDGDGRTVYAPAHFQEPFGHVTSERGRYVWSPAT